MNEQKNWLERLADKIPGYTGYRDKERRRDLDKMHRENLANRLRAIKTPLTDFMKELTHTGRLFETTSIDNAIKKLDKIENRVRFASYGYAGFFDQVKIEEAQLDLIYSFDLSLVEKVEAIEAAAAAVKTEGGTSEGLKSATTKLQDSIDAFDRTFDERYKAINEYGQGQPVGKPLFS